MISTGEIKKGVSVEVDGNLYQVVEVQHVKTKKSAVYRVKMRDLRGGHITERTFNAGEKLTAARVERRDMQFLYADGDGLTFMNTDTFDQISVPASVAGNALSYVKEGDVVQVMAYGEEALGIELAARGPAEDCPLRPGREGRHCHRRDQAGHDGDRPGRQRAPLHQ